jgi:hypothetical protein
LTAGSLNGPDGSAADPQLLRQRMAKLCFNFGYLHYWKGDKTIAYQSFKECLRYWPFAIKGWIYAGLSFVKTFAERLSVSTKAPHTAYSVLQAV